MSSSSDQSHKEELSWSAATVRLLYSFEYEQEHVEDFIKQTAKTDQGQSLFHTLPAAELEDRYFDSMAESLKGFLFGAPDHRFAGKHYVLQADLLPPYLKVFSAGTLPSQLDSPIGKSARKLFDRIPIFGPTGVELFVAPQGIGVLSIALELPQSSKEFRQEDLQTLVYSLTDERRGHSIQFVSLPDSVDFSRLDKVTYSSTDSLADRAEITTGAAKIPVWSLASLRKALLGKTTPCSDGSVTHVVVNAPPQFEISESEDPTLSRWLIGLAKAEEANHAGYGVGVESPEMVLLNRRHSVALTLRGVAHLVGDQLDDRGNEIEFNRHRLHRITNRYFAYFYVALLIRLMLRKLIEDARKIDDGNNEKIFDLQAKLTKAITFGYFAVASDREVLQRYYEHCLRAHRVEDVIRDAKRSIDELATLARLRERSAIAKSQLLLTHLAHRFEAVIIAVYAVEFGHIVWELSEKSQWQGLCSLTALSIIAMWLVLIGTHLGLKLNKNESHRFGFAWPVATSFLLCVAAGCLWFIAPKEAWNSHHVQESNVLESPALANPAKATSKSLRRSAQVPSRKSPGQPIEGRESSKEIKGQTSK